MAISLILLCTTGLLALLWLVTRNVFTWLSALLRISRFGLHSNFEFRTSSSADPNRRKAIASPGTPDPLP
jgi:hypothetical protein